MATQYDKPRVPITQPKGTAFELNWWLNSLSAPSPLRPIPAPFPVLDVNAFSDASSGTGIAFLVGPKWKAWRLLPGWQSNGCDIVWAESIAFELMAHAVTTEIGQSKCCRLYCDNQGVVEGWKNGRSCNRHVNQTFRCLYDLADQTDCTFLMQYIPSKLNPVDAPFRGKLPLYPPSFLSMHPHHSISEFLIDTTLPRSHQEIHATRTGMDFTPQ